MAERTISCGFCGKTFQVENVEFVEEYFPGTKI